MTADNNKARDGLSISPEDLVKGTLRLATLPDVFFKVGRMIDDPRSTGARVAELIGQDAALSARLLKIANSPFYGFPRRVDTLARAVTVIGTHGLRNLILASSAIKVFSLIADDTVDMAAFQRHSLLAGMAARSLAARLGAAEPEGLFAAGLIHDIGQLVILKKLPEAGRGIRVQSRNGGERLHLVERAVIGFDHGDVGGELLRQWQLPEAIWEAVKFHHAPVRAGHAPFNAAMVHVADLYASAREDTPGLDGAALAALVMEQIHLPVRRLIAVDAEMLMAVHDEIVAQLDEFSDVLLAAA